MFLREIETRPVEGMMEIAFRKIGQAGHAVPEIMHLFRFKGESTGHLIRFTEEVMRGPSPLSLGMRELIGTFVSKRSDCLFCACAHAPVAAHFLSQDLVEEVLHDLENSSLELRDKELLRYVGKVAEDPASITAADVDRLKEVGWSEEAIYDALTVAALFKFYNAWNNGSGVRNMSAADYVGSAHRLINIGYCMDFSLKAVLKVMWVSRREINYNDFKALAKICASKVVCGITGVFKRSRKGASAGNQPKVAPAASPIFTELEKGF
jgi:uncharacterized peroxidase-related enzyme